MLPNLELASKNIRENETVIECMSCKKDIFKIVIHHSPISRSTGSYPIGHNAPFDPLNEDCPLCNGQAMIHDMIEEGTIPGVLIQTNRGMVEMPFSVLENKTTMH